MSIEPIFIDKAYQGDPRYQVKVGDFYKSRNKFDEEASYLAFYWYSLAARQNLPSGIIKKAICFFEGCGVERDEKVAYDLLNRLCVGGHRGAQRVLATYLLDSQEVFNVREGLHWLSEAVAKGEKFAQWKMANLLLEGKFLEKDELRASELIEFLAEEGHKGAEYKLGCLYFEGKGVVKNYEHAAKWWNKAAQKGLSVAQYELAECYREGFGVNKDEQLAIYWLEEAATKGSIEAQIWLAECYWDGSIVGKDVDKSIFWLNEAANKGDVSAQFKLAHAYEVGLSNYQLSLFWFEKIASRTKATRTVIQACLRLSEIYSDRKYELEDKEMSGYWRQKAVDLDHCLKMKKVNMDD